MPQIAELKEIDGALWARIPLSGEQGHVQLLSETEIAENGCKLDKLLAENERMRAALTNAKEKLEIYWRARPSHEYTGGVEYSHLMQEIEAALTNEQKG